MAKKNKRPKGLPARRPVVGPADPLHRGLTALQAGRYGEAIALWATPAKTDPRVAAALAEAYFRRALLLPPGEQQVAGMRSAIDLAPNDLRYRYQLGLAQHRAGNLDAAIKEYVDVLAKDPNWPGVGAVLALAELE